jgi:excisionase family DNA binding protein
MVRVATTEALMKISDTARELAVSVRTVYRMVADQQLELVKVRGSSRIRRSDVERIKRRGK